MNRGEYHILIVDDELRMRELLSFYLEKAGFRVSEAATGQEALTKIAGDRDSYELVILDIMMPDQDGFEVCQAVREYSEVPILMLSARTEVQDRIEGLNLGADDYLTKPFEVEELLARVHALLRRALIKQTDPDKKNLVFESIS
ncbi:response regulator transcription factor [Alkalihalobacillus oceani]|uniref:response regulator transcription factor n=1 Tax=Halalkalibacter oceani TaxID=1653776 RepID=UPI00203C0844|nr:response regulator transcription factor [Halalkalibacter oceani]MCM3763058.1 response regulator transcription factor [Halalkalibacter oceani]